ncbi:unnamed protein product [Malus baccata var. baccata]
MVTAIQLQILQSPITSFISSVSTSVTMKLDDINYLTWHFQMQLLLEGHGIMGFVDGFTPCLPRFLASNSGDSEPSDPSCVHKESDDYLFSTITRTSIFQMKSELQTIKKGTDSVTVYLQRIKEARDYLSAAGVYFEDDDIVILTLNGLSSKYNTIRSVIRGRESVISLKDLRSQLLAEEAMIETLNIAPMINALSQSQSGRPYPSYNTNPSYKSFTNKNKGIFNSTTRFNTSKPFFNNGNSGSGILGSAPQFGTTPLIPCQICGKTNHLADTCRFRSSQGCQICGKPNHMAITCRF